MQTKPVPFGIDCFDLEDEVPGAAKSFSRKRDSLADRERAVWLNTFDLDIGPLGIAFPLDEVLPDYLDRCGNDSDGTHA
jgi:hypothetical protein